MSKIDIKAVFKEKNPKLYKRLPEAFFKYLQKITHEDEINQIIENHGHKGSIVFLNEILKAFEIKSEVQGIENLPQNSNIILASNHPLGSIDGLLLIKLLYDKYGKAKSLVNDMLMDLGSLKNFFIGFDQYKKTARSIIKEFNEILSSDTPILYFPSGMVARKYGKEITEPEWLRTFITNAVNYNREIVPAFINGRLSNSFYRKATARRRLKIKTNIELLYLADEMFKLKQKTIKITIGKPIKPETFSKSKSKAQWAELLRQYTYKLNENPNLIFKE